MSTFILSKYFSTTSLEKRSQDWIQLGEVNSSEELQAFAEEHPKTVPGLVARFQRARVALQQSLERIYADGAREQALKELKEAEETYAELANDKEARDKPLLVQEALMGVAKAREGRGDLDGALEASGYKERTIKSAPRRRRRGNEWRGRSWQRCYSSAVTYRHSERTGP